MSDFYEALKAQLVTHYIESMNFNGLPVSSLPTDGTWGVYVEGLITAGLADLVRGDIHPNPHIKALPPETPQEQLEKIDGLGYEGCLYPTPKLLAEHHAGQSEEAPYTRALLQGSPQLGFRTFDLRVLDWYRNDPNYWYRTSDYQGQILKARDFGGTRSTIINDSVDYLSFGFAYSDTEEREVAIFLRDLHKLNTAQQKHFETFELPIGSKLHPGFYQTAIVGDYPNFTPVCEAILRERGRVNDICVTIGKPPLFKTGVELGTRPDGFYILHRPTSKEYYEFCSILDKLMGDDIDHNFFKGEIETFTILVNDKGDKIKQKIPSIRLLEKFLETKFKTSNNTPVLEILRSFRCIRKLRQTPAHKLIDKEFDQKFIAEQRKLLSSAQEGLRNLRLIFESHPHVKSQKEPDDLATLTICYY